MALVQKGILTASKLLSIKHLLDLIVNWLNTD